MLGLPSWFFTCVFLALAVLAGRAFPASRAAAGASRLSRVLESRWAPVIAGAATGLAIWWVWGSLHASPVMHDESAYLLQAEIFARFRWTASPPPVPAFFEQLYVLVDGALASKYPPGNSLFLALGAFVGAPGLVIVLTNAGVGALTFALARRIGGAMVGALTWLLWLASFPTLYFRATYMSESVSSLAWLAAWWGILEWRDGRGRRWLALAATAVGWCAITRPLTALALGVVTAAVVAGEVLRRPRGARPWRDLVPALASGIAVLAVIPLWSWRTTGDPALAPLTAYTRNYVPFDRPGFGVAPGAQPSRRLPRDQWLASAAFYQEHQRHTPRALPGIAAGRLAMLDRDAWYGWRGALRVFAVLALLLLPVAGWVALGAAALQIALYLSYAHPPGWTLYYAELSALPAMLTALGVVRFISWVCERSTRGRPSEAPAAHTVVAGGLLLAGGMFALVTTAAQVRVQVRSDHAYYDRFAMLLRRIPESRAVVFVRYAPDHNDNLSLVRNSADAAEARVWTVYDRGARNDSLLALVPDRAGYLYDEAAGVLAPLRRLASMPAAPAGATH